MLVADQVADVLHCREVAQAAGVDELRAVVGEDGFCVTAVDLIELGLGLPDGDELDAGAGDGRGPLRQLGQGSVRRLVEEDEEPRIERVSGVVVAIEGLADEVVEKNGEHDADAGLVPQWRGEVERVSTAEEPVEGDVAAVGGRSDLRVSPGPDSIASRGVDARSGPRVRAPLAV